MAVQEQDITAYQNVEGIAPFLEAGDIALVGGSYLIKIQEKGETIKRRQEVDEVEFVPAASAVGNLRMANSNTPYPSEVIFYCFALSYKWLSASHPDPQGHHLKIVARHLRTVRALPPAGLQHHQPAGFGYAMFWDFISMFQKPRTEMEDQMFKRGLRASNIIYGHTLVAILMQPTLPHGYLGEPYENSGWCFFEASVASLSKRNMYFIHLKTLPDGCPYHGDAGAMRQVPMEPVVFSQKLMLWCLQMGQILAS